MLILEKNFAFPLNWNFKREITYRLLDKIEYVNNFFDTGELLISCFEKFKNYPNEFQGDKREGHGMIAGTDDKGGVNAVIFESGINAFVMSTTIQKSEKIISDFNAKGAIKIIESSYFAMEIARKLPFVNSGVEGFCDYTPSRVAWLKENSKENEQFQNIDFKNDPDSGEKFKYVASGDELFIKSLEYAYQDEYRYIWFSREIVRDSYLIRCPEAIQYCEKIIF